MCGVVRYVHIFCIAASYVVMGDELAADEEGQKGQRGGELVHAVVGLQLLGSFTLPHLSIVILDKQKRTAEC